MGVLCSNTFKNCVGTTPVITLYCKGKPLMESIGTLFSSYPKSQSHRLHVPCPDKALNLNSRVSLITCHHLILPAASVAGISFLTSTQINIRTTDARKHILCASTKDYRKRIFIFIYSEIQWPRRGKRTIHYASGRKREIPRLFSGCLKEHHNNKITGNTVPKKVTLPTCDLEHKDSKVPLCLTQADYKGQHCVRPLYSLLQNTNTSHIAQTLALLSMQKAFSLYSHFPNRR